MIKRGYMTQEQADKYVHYVSRKGKALSLPPEQLEKFQSEYDKIVTFLKENLLNYVIFMSAGGTNRYNKHTMKLAIARAKRNGLIADIQHALKIGDAETFVQKCSGLRKNYSETVDDILIVHKTFKHFVSIYAEKNGVEDAIEKIDNIPIEGYLSVFNALEAVLKEQGILAPSEISEVSKEE